jgi:hypothetical protein
VECVLAQAAGMAAEAEVLATEPGAAAESADMSHAAEMCAAAKARMSAAEAAAAKAGMSTAEAAAAMAAAAATCLGRSDR